MNSRRFRRRASFIAISLAALSISAASHAQSTQSQGTTSADAPEGKVGIADVVVTAQKRSECLQDVPVSVAAVSPLTLERAGVQTIDSLPTLVSGLVINNSPTAFRPFLRGVGTAAAGNVVRAYAGGANPGGYLEAQYRDPRT